MAKIQIKESLLREIIKNQVVKVMNENKALKKVNEAYFGDGGEDEEYQGLQNFPQDNIDYDLVYGLCERFPRVGEQKMSDAVSYVWNYTKPQRENLEALKEYLGININEAKSPKNKKKFDKVMGEFAKGTLKTAAGKKVTDQKQALAIAYSESDLDEELVGGQKNIDKNKNGKLDSEDFKMLRKDKK